MFIRIRFARRTLVKVLSRDPLVRVMKPSTKKIHLSQDATNENYHMLQDFFAVSAGRKVRLEQSGDVVVQEIFYNGRTH